MRALSPSCSDTWMEDISNRWVNVWGVLLRCFADVCYVLKCLYSVPRPHFSPLTSLRRTEGSKFSFARQAISLVASSSSRRKTSSGTSPSLSTYSFPPSLLFSPHLAGRKVDNGLWDGYYMCTDLIELPPPRLPMTVCHKSSPGLSGKSWKPVKSSISASRTFTWIRRTVESVEPSRNR